MVLLTVFLQMLSLLLMIATGWLITRQGLLDGRGSETLSKLIIHVFNPLLALSSASEAAGQIPLAEMGEVALVAAGMFLAFILMGMVLAPFFDKDPFQRKLFQLMFTFSNLGFIGVPVVNSVLGAEYVVFVTEFMLIYNLVIYTYGMALLEGEFSLSSLKVMLNPGNLMSFAAILLLVLGVRLPGFIETAASAMSGAVTPLAMLTIGYALANASLRRIFADPRLYLFSLVKLLVVPLGALALLRAAPLERELLPVCLLMIAMPVGNMPLILGTEKGIDCSTCSAGIIMTTLLCVLTIPVLAAVM